MPLIRHRSQRSGEDFGRSCSRRTLVQNSTGKGVISCARARQGERGEREESDFTHVTGFILARRRKLRLQRALSAAWRHEMKGIVREKQRGECGVFVEARMAMDPSHKRRIEGGGGISGERNFRDGEEEGGRHACVIYQC